jgi:hypothetical protein
VQGLGVEDEGVVVDGSVGGDADDGVVFAVGHFCEVVVTFGFSFGVGSVCARRMVGNLAVPIFLFWVENGLAAALFRTDWDRKVPFVMVRMQKVEVGSLCRRWRECCGFLSLSS